MNEPQVAKNKYRRAASNTARQTKISYRLYLVVRAGSGGTWADLFVAGPILGLESSSDSCAVAAASHFWPRNLPLADDSGHGTVSANVAAQLYPLTAGRYRILWAAIRSDHCIL
jgi:hypothetical protein